MRADRFSLAWILKSNSGPSIPPAGSFTVSSANRAEPAQNHPQIPPTRLFLKVMAKESERFTECSPAGQMARQ
jgi:hypothetical protein